jgi:uncharacterized RDD family membrane protein YckC
MVKHLRRRLISWWWDYVVVVAWLTAVFLLLGLPTVLGWLDLSGVWSHPIAADVAVTVLTVVPFGLYLVITEQGPAHATWGKRRSGLVVEAADGSTADLRRIVVRNFVKVLPWQFGHMAALRFAGGTTPGPAAVLYAASLVLLVLIVGPVVASRRGLHDRVAGTTVRPAPASPHAIPHARR